MAITNFEKETTELTHEELKLIPLLICGFKTHKKNNPITAPAIVALVNKYCNDKKLGLKITEVRLRKCVNYIRANAMLPVMAASNGYYVSNDKKEIEKQIQSLLERAASIESCAKGLQNILRTI